ncbi:acyl-CoA synthetase [Azovibrio restrictus]|uniref:LpxL/LpxP family acyltransferase n=1 Tax=Azovibrio restrictus TaxID=146938 RepID=UPI0026F022CF|nr:acyl-CoA synthetase [Azovibrio restrictus]MDD3484045.1 acyl-CoA synthetase [Azovibrio restrictus]
MSGTANPGKAAPNPWMGQAERSNMAILRLMVWISLSFGRPLGRLVLYGIAAYFTLFSPKARRASRQYLEKVRGRPAGWSDCFRHVLAFASTIHDRIYLLNDRFDLFEIEVVGAEALLAQLERQPGALLMGAHLGSFEVLRAMGRSQAGLRVAMLMYEENARKINATLAAINPKATQDILPLGQVDSMLKAQEMLDQGCLVGMLADRGLGDDERRPLDFLGSPAGFPTGPFRVAALLRRPVFFMTGLYLGGNRYRLHFEPLADFSQVSRSERAAAMDGAMAAYAARLEQHCRQAPYNWFNFFDFWQ